MNQSLKTSRFERRPVDDFLALNRRLDGIFDLDVLLERILEVACDWVWADGGSIYLREGDHLRIAHTRCRTLQERLPPGKKLIFTSFRIPISRDTISGYVAKTGESVNIADVYALGDSVPYRHGHDFDEKANYRTRSMIAVPMRTQRGDVVGVLQIVNRMSNDGAVLPFLEAELDAMNHFALRAGGAIDHARLTRDLVLRMIAMAELRDPVETGQHANRVAAYAVELYEAWAVRHDVPKDEVDHKRALLRTAAMLHDVGKVAIPDAILHKPDKLTAEEFEVIKTHTTIGAQLLSGAETEMEAMAQEIALDHHANWDGTGYPEHMIEPGRPQRPKKGEEIPLMAQLVALADMFDALSAWRSYKRAWTDEEIVAEIRRQSGRKFSPELVEFFLENHEHLLAIKARYPELTTHRGRQSG